MAVTFTDLDSDGSDGVATSKATASVAPTAGRTLFLWSVNKADSGAAVTPAVTGLGLVWTPVIEMGGGSSRRLCLHVAQVGPNTPTPGAVTMSFGQDTEQAAWSLVQSSERCRVIQAPTEDDSGEGDFTLTVTLASFRLSTNSVLGCLFLGNDGQDVTPGSGFTELAEVELDGAVSQLTRQSQYQATEDTSCDWSWDNYTGTFQRGGAVEVEPSAGVAPYHYRRRRAA